jgi:hypothetical protein
MPRIPSLQEIIHAAIASHADGVHVALPGRVVSYNPATQTAAVKPSVSIPIRTLEGAPSYEQTPTIPDVPVAWTSGGGCTIALFLAPGDPVMLVFSDVSMGDYLASGADADPLDTRRHSMGHPIAIPGGARPDPHALADAPSSPGVVIGIDGADGQIRIDATGIKLGKTATDFVALAALVDARIETLRADLVAVAGAVPFAVPDITVPLASVSATLTKAK